MNYRQKENGIALVGVALGMAVVVIIALAGYFVVLKTNKKVTESTGVSKTSVDAENKGVKIKHLGIDLGYYDASTNKAGDVAFTKGTLQFKRLFFEYGFIVPANSVGPEKKNPQPTFILPLGTKVHALIDGEVAEVPKLYSGDYSVMLQGKGSDLIFETEHVMNVKVKKGDIVKAGDVIAEVSDYDAKNYGGMGLVEIGVLKGSSDSKSPPSHLCPFAYLDESIQEETFKKILALQTSWESYIGDATIYNETATSIPGCAIVDPIEG